jgi:hypothetical protein
VGAGCRPEVCPGPRRGIDSRAMLAVGVDPLEALDPILVFVFIDLLDDDF